MMKRILFAILSAQMSVSNVNVNAFVTPSAKLNLNSFTTTATATATVRQDTTDLNMITESMDSISTIISSVSVVDAAPSMILSETEPWVQPLANVLGPFLNIFSFAMLCRVVISWYPTANLNELPFNLVVWPTEPLLRVVRGSVPPAFGVDITPIVWLAIFTFFNEILLGQQGLLTMKIKYGI